MCPENEDVSSVINLMIFLWKKNMIIMKIVMKNLIMIMTITASVTVVVAIRSS